MSTPRPARWALASLSLSMLLPSLATSLAYVALPTVAAEFDVPFRETQWVVLAYLTAIPALTVSAGRMGDVVGRRRLLLAGIATFTAASVLCGVSPTLWLLVAARAAQGAGAAVMLALSVALVADTVPPAQTGRTMGLLGTMSAAGTTLGPALGGLAIAGLGWRVLFLAIVPLSSWTAYLTSRYLPTDRPLPTRALSPATLVSTLLLTLALGGGAAALSARPSGEGAVLLGLPLTAAIALGAFAVVEARAASPLIRWSMFRRATFTAGLAMNALVAAIMMATLVVGPFYLSGALELSPTRAGLAMSVGPLVAALAGVPSGWLVDRRGPSLGAIAGIAAMAAGSLALSMLPLALGTIGYLVPIACMTAGYALFQAANNTDVTGSSGPDERGAVAGLLTLSRNVGLVTGASVMGAVFAHGSGGGDLTTTPPATVAAGVRLAFASASTLALAALAIAMHRASRPDPLRRRPNPHDARSHGPTVPVVGSLEPPSPG